MSKSSIEYLKHIRDELEYLEKASAELDKDKFINNLTLQRAFTRSLEIIGEATKNLPSDFKDKYSYLDWKSMAGMRDKLIHHYFGVDYDIVWDVVINEAPKLKKQISKILGSLEKSANFPPKRRAGV